jgi:hypothetical protein
MARLASEKDAADYVGLEVATFWEWVSFGRLPPPIADCGKYDLKGIAGATNALDAWRANKQCA